MILFILAIVILMISGVLIKKGIVGRETALFIILLACSFMIVGIKLIGYAENTKKHIKDSQIAIAEQYKTSNKSEEDWKITLSRLKQTNERVKTEEEQKIIYALFDSHYLFTLFIPTNSFIDYAVTIYDDKVVFPEHYKVLDLVKGLSQDTTQDTTEPTTEATYKETEINGTKYQLVPIEW